MLKIKELNPVSDHVHRTTHKVQLSPDQINQAIADAVAAALGITPTPTFTVELSNISATSALGDLVLRAVVTLIEDHAETARHKVWPGPPMDITEVTG